VTLCQPGPQNRLRVAPGIGVTVGVGDGVGDGLGVGPGTATGAENSEVLPSPSVAVAVTLGPPGEPGKLQLPAPSAVVEPSYTLPSSSSSE
jgi:hypothetical protein